MRRWLIFVILLFMSTLAFGQLYPERHSVRQGNRRYERENYVEAEAKYMGALSKNPASAEANFNLGDALYRQGRFEEAEQRFGALGQLPVGPEQWAQGFYNQGNAQVRQYQNTSNKEKLTQALEAYKQSLRLNPDDREAKFNLAYVQKLLENENGGGGGENNQDQDQDQNQDQDQDQNQGQNQNQDQQNNDEQPDEGQQSPPEGRMSREEAEQLLNAMQNSEDRTREKVDEQAAAAAARSGKNW